jgi:hypothetical protein
MSATKKESPMHAFRLHLLCLVIVALAWSAATAADPATPSGAAASWAELRGVRDAIAADVGAGRLGEIHARSERLVPLANALLQGSKDLAPEKRAQVESAVKQLPKVAGALHEAADAGNGEATRRQLERLDGLLELIRAQYPPGALPWSTPAGSGHATPTPSGHHHAMHEHVHALAMGAAPG